MADSTEELIEFLEYLWGTDSPDGKPTFVYLPVKDEAGKWVKYTFAWPRSREGVIQHILTLNAQGCDVYFSPALYKAARPVKENVKGTWSFWVDLDGNAPQSLPNGVPAPSLVIQSSLIGHEHWYWRLGEFLPADPPPNVAGNIEERNRALALVLGADSSGWDTNQVLRPPGTTNYRRGKTGGEQIVTVKEWDR